MSNQAFPPQYPPVMPSATPSATPRRGGRVVGAALLVGALAGGAAGFGGAALMHETTASSAAPLTYAPYSVSSPASTVTSAGSTETAAARALPSVVKIYASSSAGSGSGSGIILTKDGEILTNNHVVELSLNGGGLAVSFNDGTTKRATIVGRDPLTDLAVIKVNGETNLKPATLGKSSSLQVGQQVVAVGAPFGLESTVTTGIVSALNRPVTTQGESMNDPTTIFPAIQTDAAINPGNSGGPLVNMAGQVVGIDSAIRTASSNSPGSSQSGSIGLGFAIPIDDALPIVQQLRDGQTPTHARIGVTVTDATSKLDLPYGAKVRDVVQGQAGATAGLRRGDVITKLNREVVSDANSLVAGVREYRPGAHVTLTVKSPSGVRTVDVTLGSDG